MGGAAAETTEDQQFKGLIAHLPAESDNAFRLKSRALLKGLNHLVIGH